MCVCVCVLILDGLSIEIRVSILILRVTNLHSPSGENYPLLFIIHVQF